MEQPTVEVASEVTARTSASPRGKDDGKARLGNAALFPILAAAIAVWFITIRTPLWVDETVSFWQVDGGFGQIWARQGLSFPAYSYILWIFKTVFGSSTLALRTPSIIAMLAALYVLYRIAREFFPHETALIVTIVFALHPVVVFAAIDARPYAMGVLVINCAILTFLRWMRTHQDRYAILFGLFAGAIFYFHYLFGVILLAFGLLLIVAKDRNWNSFKSQLVKAAIAFAVVMLPVISRLEYMIQTRQSHVITLPTGWNDLAQTLAPGSIALFFAFAALVAAAFYQLEDFRDQPASAGLTCLLLAFIPALLLYEVDTLTPLHVFLSRYRLVAVPGIALCWGLLLSRISSRVVRVLFCVALVGTVARAQLDVPLHGSSWKSAVDVVNNNTATDHAAVLVCSTLVEGDFLPIPPDIYSTGLFAPLTYYKLDSPLVLLPRSITPEGEAKIQSFLKSAVSERKRFIAMGLKYSSPVFQHIGKLTENTYTSKRVGEYDEVLVFEYDPR